MKQQHSLFLYETIASDLRHAITGNVYVVHDRMPSLRAISNQYGVSISTAIQAYELLERDGLISARSKSGYFVRHWSPSELNVPEPIIPLSIPTSVNVGQLAMSLVHETRAKNLAKLGAAVPAADMLPLAPLSRIMAGVTRRMWQLPGTYADSQGAIELRRQIAKLMKDAGCSCHPDEIIVTNGALEAITLALRAVAKSGDVIAIESPTYFGVLQVIESLGMKALEITTHPHCGIDVDALQTRLNKCQLRACVLMPNVNNPLGSTMPDANKQKVVQMLTKAEIPLIEDDIFSVLSYTKNRPKAAKAFDNDNSVLLCSSFSKTLAPGYRIGWIVPGKYMEQVKYQKFLDNISTSIIPQMTIAEYLARGGYQREMGRKARIYKQRMDQLRYWVNQYFPPGTRLTNPQGGLVLWIELPAKIDSFELYKKALAKRIAISPGVLFSPRQQFKNYVRLSCGTLAGEAALGAVKKAAKLAFDLL